MRVKMGCVSSTADVSASVRQVDVAFSRVVAERAADMPEFELLEELAISTSVGPWEEKLRRSVRQGICFVAQNIAYKAWVAADWPERVDLMAAAFLAGLEAVPRKRILDSERAALRNIAELARLGAQGAPPACVERIVPFGDAQPVAPAEERLFKLYKRIEGRLHYREGWIGDHHRVTEHWGACGEEGSTRTYGCAGAADALLRFRSSKAEARAAGFRSIPPSRHATLVVEIAIDGMGNRIDLSRRHALEDFLDQQAGWLGLGHCDGGSSGSGSMEVFCLVVDFAIAEAALRAALLNSPFSDFASIHRMPN